MNSTIPSRRCLGTEQLEHLTIDYCQQAASELPESLLAKHRIMLNLGNNFHVEQWYNGCYQTNQLHPGEFTFLPMGMSRRVVWDRSIEFLLIDLDANYVRQMMLGLSDRDLIEIVPHYKRQDPLIHAIGLTIKQELISHHVREKLYIESLIATLTLQLLRHHTTSTSIAQNSIGKLDRERLEILTNYINNHLDRDLSLDELATIVKMNKFYLIRSFKRSTGNTLHRYVTNCRIEQAKQLLIDGDRSIVEICHVVGFDSQSHFTKVFHRHVGIPPGIYRDRSRSRQIFQ